MKPSELAAIVQALKRRKDAEARREAIDAYHDQRNHWAFLAAVIANGFAGLAGMFSKRTPKMSKPEDFIDKRLREAVNELMGAQAENKTDWASRIADAKAKGLRGPW